MVCTCHSDLNDLDIVLPTRTSQGYLFPSPVGSGTTLNPNFGDIDGMLLSQLAPSTMPWKWEFKKR